MIALAAVMIRAHVDASDVDETVCPACGGDCIEQEEGCCGQPYRDGSCCGRSCGMVTTWVCEVCDGGRSPRCQPLLIFGRNVFAAEPFSCDLDEEIPF